MDTKPRKMKLAEIAQLIRPRDSLICGFVAGQPVGLLEAIGVRTDLEEVVLYTGLLMRPFGFLQNPAVKVVSGFFGPIERMARSAGARVSCGLQTRCSCSEPQSLKGRIHSE
jgi:hypothetical protein